MTSTETIDAILKEINMSRRQLAIKAGIPPSSFQSAMQRNGNLSLDMLEKVARALEIELYQILGDDFAKAYFQAEVDTTKRQFEQGYRFTTKEKALVRVFHQLNEDGKDTALERLCELAEIPKYQLKED